MELTLGADAWSFVDPGLLDEGTMLVPVSLLDEGDVDASVADQARTDAVMERSDAQRFQTEPGILKQLPMDGLRTGRDEARSPVL